MINIFETILMWILISAAILGLIVLTYYFLKFLAKKDVEREMQTAEKNQADKMDAQNKELQQKWNELENAQTEETHRHEHFKLEEKEAYRVFIIQQDDMRRKEKEAEEKIRNVEKFKGEMETKMQLLERQIEKLKKELSDSRQRAIRLAKKPKIAV